MENSTGADTPAFTAKDLRETANVSYRQLGDWDSKGATPKGTREDRGWRRYNGLETFAILVCAEIRSRFGVPLKSLAWLQQQLSDPEAHLLASVGSQMKKYGFSVFLVTDLKEHFQVVSDIELADLLQHGAFFGNSPAGYVLLKLNPIVNDVLRLAKMTQISEHKGGYRFVSEAIKSITVMTQGELDALSLARSGQFEKITVRSKKGSIRMIETERSVPLSAESELRKLIESQDFQNIEISRRDGTTTHITQRISQKYDEKIGHPKS